MKGAHEITILNLPLARCLDQPKHPPSVDGSKNQFSSNQIFLLLSCVGIKLHCETVWIVLSVNYEKRKLAFQRSITILESTRASGSNSIFD